MPHHRKCVRGWRGAALIAGAINSAPLLSDFFGYFLVRRQESNTPLTLTHPRTSHVILSRRRRISVPQAFPHGGRWLPEGQSDEGNADSSTPDFVLRSE